MQAPNFHRAASLGVELINHYSLAEAYRTLGQRFRSVESDPKNPQGSAINQELLALKAKLDSSRPQLTPGQAEAFRILGLDEVLGRKASERIDSTFRDLVGNHVAIAERFEQFAQEAQDVLSFCTRVVNRTKRLLPAKSADDSPALRIMCTGGADARDLGAVASRADDWDHILRELAQVAGDAAESPPLRDLHKGSVIFDVLMAPATWVVVSGAIAAAIKGLEFVAKLKAMRKESAQLSLPTEVFEARIAEAVKQARDEALAAIRPAAPLDPEQTARAGQAIEKIVLFLSDGGQVHYLPGPNTSDKETAARFNGAVQEFYALRDGKTDSPRLPADGTRDGA